MNDFMLKGKKCCSGLRVDVFTAMRGGLCHSHLQTVGNTYGTDITCMVEQCAPSLFVLRRSPYTKRHKTLHTAKSFGTPDNDHSPDHQNAVCQKFISTPGSWYGVV